MNKRKTIILIVVVAFIVIQFFRPDRNNSGQVYEKAITQLYPIPDNVNLILQQSCVNCHSNNTEYPWYAKVQPVGWFLNYHIRNAKEQLNLDEFAEYSERKRINKLRSIRDQVKDGEMPLWSYTLMHEEAKLSETEKSLLVDWLNTTIDSLKTIQRNKYLKYLK